MPPTSACRSRSSTRRRTPAASASIAAASRRRRCCTSPRSRRGEARGGVGRRRSATPKIDLDKLRAFKHGVVDKLTGGVGQVAKLRKVKYLQGRADAHRADDARGRRRRPAASDSCTFEHAILATGSQPTKIPALSIDSPRVMDSTGALDLPDVPKSLLVDRRRLHRPRARDRLRRARHQGVGRRDDAGPAARRRSRSRRRPRASGSRRLFDA